MSSFPTVTVNIRNLAHGGAGAGEVVAQSDHGDDLLGISAFVPYVAVGETVTAQIVRRKKRHLETELVEVQSPSASRVTPKCEYFASCGGCELQHLAYDAQRRAKYQMIRSSLLAARLDSAAVDKLQHLVASAPYGYRRRVTLHVDTAGNVGFYRTNSRSVVRASSCAVAVPAINEVLRTIQDFGGRVQGKVSSIMLEADEEGVIAVLKCPYAVGSLEKRELLEGAKHHFKSVVILAGEEEIGGFGRRTVELLLNDSGALVLQVPAGNFSQANVEINRALIRRVVETSGATTGSMVYDLYAGAGNFTLPLAREGAKVLAIENDPRLVSYGRQNIARYELERRVQFREMDVQRFLKRHERGTPVDVIVADPPRNGLGGLVSLLPRAKKLLLVSCHLSSCTRDIKTLSESGWRVTEIQPFDMFAQTSHIEVLSVFERA